MARFITFYKDIPLGVPPRDYHLYSVGSYQLDSSEPRGKTKCSDTDIKMGIQRSESENKVASWKEAADHYELSEIDYD